MNKLFKFFSKIRYPNSYDSETLVKYIRKRGGNVGENVYIYDSCHARIDTNNAHFISIGNNVLITEGVIVLGHDYSYSVVANVYSELLKKQRKTVIGNNVFLGMNAIILMGAEIGDNSIIGAGSVVSGILEGNAVYAGNPAKKICSIEEYYHRLKDNFVRSAEIYAQSKADSIEQMSVYRVLFEEHDSFREYIRRQHFNGISSDVVNNLNIDDYPHLKWEDLGKTERK